VDAAEKRKVGAAPNDPDYPIDFRAPPHLSARNRQALMLRQAAQSHLPAAFYGAGIFGNHGWTRPRMDANKRELEKCRRI
jgi:hypothetical protein